MSYDDKVLVALEDILSFEELDCWQNNIDKVIALERGLGSDKMRPEVLADEIANNIANGVWERNVPDEFVSWGKENDYNFEYSY